MPRAPIADDTISDDEIEAEAAVDEERPPLVRVSARPGSARKSHHKQPGSAPRSPGRPRGSSKKAPSVFTQWGAEIASNGLIYLSLSLTGGRFGMEQGEARGILQPVLSLAQRHLIPSGVLDIQMPDDDKRDVTLLLSSIGRYATRCLKAAYQVPAHIQNAQPGTPPRGPNGQYSRQPTAQAPAPQARAGAGATAASGFEFGPDAEALAYMAQAGLASDVVSMGSGPEAYLAQQAQDRADMPEAIEAPAVPVFSPSANGHASGIGAGGFADLIARGALPGYRGEE